MMMAAIIYASIPPPVHPNSTNASRISVGSMLKYSPIPPHTPQSIRCFLDLYNLLSVITILLSYEIKYITRFYCVLSKSKLNGPQIAVCLDLASAPVIRFHFIIKERTV